MSIPSYMGLNTALTGLQVAQEELDTTSNNIANASTAGYSREQVVATPTLPFNTASGYAIGGSGVQVGTGVDGAAIQRIRSQFLDVQYRAQNSTASAAGEQATDLGQVQTALAEPGSYGISTQLQNFWTSWSELANNPSNMAARQSVIDAGTTLAQGFNSLQNSLSSLQS